MCHAHFMRRAWLVCTAPANHTVTALANWNLLLPPPNSTLQWKFMDVIWHKWVQIVFENILEEMGLIFSSSTTHFVMFFYFGTFSFNETSVFFFFTEFMSLDWWNDLIFCRYMALMFGKGKPDPALKTPWRKKYIIITKMNSTLSYSKQSFEP